MRAKSLARGEELYAPIQVSLLGAQAVAARAHEHPHLLKQFGFARRGRMQLNSHRVIKSLSLRHYVLLIQPRIRRKIVRDLLRMFVYFSLGGWKISSQWTILACI